MTGAGSGAPAAPVDAVVLAGGQARRLGGAVKPEVHVAGRAMLDRVLDATAGARHVVVVGPEALARPGTTTVLEDPPSGGPVAGIDAGFRALGMKTAPADAAPAPESVVLVLACDVPLAARVVPDLLAALGGHPAADGAVVVDGEGRQQPLLAAYRHRALLAALERRRADGGVHGCSVRRLVDGLQLVPVADPTGAARDADTWDAVAELEREIAGGTP